MLPTTYSSLPTTYSSLPTTHQGSVVSNMPFADSEGEARCLHVAGGEKGSYVAVGTDKGVIKAQRRY